jgi:hypothetical protein
LLSESFSGSLVFDILFSGPKFRCKVNLTFSYLRIKFSTGSFIWARDWENKMYVASLHGSCFLAIDFNGQNYKTFKSKLVTTMSSHCYSFIYLFDRTGVWAQGFAHAKLTLYSPNNTSHIAILNSHLILQSYTQFL